MKKLGIVLACSVLLAACNGTKTDDSGGKVTLKTQDQKASYALGFRSAQQMRNMDGLDINDLVAGLRDGFKDKPKSRLGDADLDKLIHDYQMRMMKKQKDKKDKEAKTNEKKSEAFLEDNAKKDGVKTTKDGIEYKVLESGKKGAASPTLDDTVKVDYVGKLIDGTVFDSSIKRGKPAVFGLKHIIPGWQKILPMMKVGDKWRVWIPPKLAYGEQGAGDQIGPNQVLVFDIKLLGINQPEDDNSGSNGGGKNAK